MKSVAKKEIRVGRWVRVIYDDVGARDGVVVDTSCLKEGSLTVLIDDYQASVEIDQITRVGTQLQAKDSGLDT